MASDGSIIFQEAAINPGALSAAASEVFGNGRGKHIQPIHTKLPESSSQLTSNHPSHHT